MKDTAGDKYCPLCELEVKGLVNISIVKLDKLRLAELVPEQLNQELEGATTKGCMVGMTKEELIAYKAQFKHHRVDSRVLECQARRLTTAGGTVDTVEGKSNDKEQ
jgi:hypothetical protein